MDAAEASGLGGLLPGKKKLPWGLLRLPRGEGSTAYLSWGLTPPRVGLWCRVLLLAAIVCVLSSCSLLSTGTMRVSVGSGCMNSLGTPISAAESLQTLCTFFSQILSLLCIRSQALPTGRTGRGMAAAVEESAAAPAAPAAPGTAGVLAPPSSPPAEAVEAVESCCRRAGAPALPLLLLPLGTAMLRPRPGLLPAGRAGVAGVMGLPKTPGEETEPAVLLAPGEETVPAGEEAPPAPAPKLAAVTEGAIFARIAVLSGCTALPAADPLPPAAPTPPPLVKEAAAEAVPAAALPLAAGVRGEGTGMAWAAALLTPPPEGLLPILIASLASGVLGASPMKLDILPSPATLPALPPPPPPTAACAAAMTAPLLLLSIGAIIRASAEGMTGPLRECRPG